MSHVNEPSPFSTPNPPSEAQDQSAGTADEMFEGDETKKFCNETEDFRPSRFRELFRKLLLSFQHYVMSPLYSISQRFVSPSTGKTVDWETVKKVGERYIFYFEITEVIDCIINWRRIRQLFRIFDHKDLTSFTFRREFTDEFIKVKIPDLRGGGPTTHNGGTKTQGGQGTCQVNRLVSSWECVSTEEGS